MKNIFFYSLLSIVFISCNFSANRGKHKDLAMHNPSSQMLQIDRFYSNGNISYQESPYSFIMNKYLDLLCCWEGGWSEDFANKSIEEKNAILSEMFQPLVDGYNMNNNFPDSFLEYLDTIFVDLKNDINNHPVIQQYIIDAFEDEVYESWVEDSLETIVDYESLQMSSYLIVNGNAFPKMDILFFYENNINIVPSFLSYNLCTTTMEDYSLEIDQAETSPRHITRLGHNYDEVDLIKWPNNTIIYSYVDYFGSQDVVDNAANEWKIASNHSLVFKKENYNVFFKFKEWFRNSILDLYFPYISIHALRKYVNGQKAKTSIGFLSKGGFMFLKPNASFSTCLHEWGHVLGFIHEFQRCDRDSYLQIDTSLISQIPNLSQRKYIQNLFRKIDNAQYLPDDNTPLDLNSIMMYGSDFVKINGNSIMLDIDGNEIIRSNQLSEYDIEGVRSMYN